jgi:Kef-type K+ transport system membrane component KefB
VLPFVLGWGLMRVVGESGPSALFVGTAMVATSVGVTARVLADRGKLATKEARIIMAAAVIDDVLALMMLAIVSGMAQGELSLAHTALVIGLALAFLVTVLTVGRATLRRTFPFLTRLRATDPVLGAAIAIALLLAVSADFVGLAPIVGAYIAGVLIARWEAKRNSSRRCTRWSGSSPRSSSYTLARSWNPTSWRTPKVSRW